VSDIPLTAEQQTLVSDNLLLAWKYAKTNRPPPPLSQDEWESECLMVMVIAARGFDSQRGFKFSTYAYQCFRHRWMRLHERHEFLKKKGLETIPLGELEKSIKDERKQEAKALEVWEEANILLDILSRRERHVIRQRMSGMRLRKIGERLGLSRERVRQIESGAMEKMREYAQVCGLVLGS